MIDITTEPTFSLSDAPARLDVRRRGGKPIHRATVFRWASHGIGGVKLETIRIGGTRCTSLAALSRFFARLSEKPSDIDTAHPIPTRERVRQVARVDRELDAMGV